MFWIFYFNSSIASLILSICTIDFSLMRYKDFWWWMVVSLNCTLKNGYDGIFYVIFLTTIKGKWHQAFQIWWFQLWATLQNASADANQQVCPLFLFSGTQNTMTRMIHKLTYLTWCLKATLGSITLLKDLRKTFSLLLRSLASKTLSLNLTS